MSHTQPTQPTPPSLRPMWFAALSPEQRVQLAPAFAADRDAKDIGSLIAQVWPDGITVTRLNSEESKAVQRALGITHSGFVSSASEQLAIHRRATS